MIKIGDGASHIYTRHTSTHIHTKIKYLSLAYLSLAARTHLHRGKTQFSKQNSKGKYDQEHRVQILKTIADLSRLRVCGDERA